MTTAKKRGAVFASSKNDELSNHLRYVQLVKHTRYAPWRPPLCLPADRMEGVQVRSHATGPEDARFPSLSGGARYSQRKGVAKHMITQRLLLDEIDALTDKLSTDELIVRCSLEQA